MATEFTHTIGMLVPEPLWQQAGDIIALISNNTSDRSQFGKAKFSGGYDACNNPAKAEHIDALLAVHNGLYVPPRPSFDVDGVLDIAALVELVRNAQLVTGIAEGFSLEPGALVFGINVSAEALAAGGGLVRLLD